MASVSWTSTTSGLWSSSTNWAGGAAPQDGDSVTINPTSSVTVTYGNTAPLYLHTLSTGSSATLDVISGTLTVATSANLQGAFIESGGFVKLAASSGAPSFNNNLTLSGGQLVLDGASSAGGSGTLTQSGGTLTVQNGNFQVSDNYVSLNGAITGNGVLSVGSNNVTLGSAVSLGTAGFVINSGNVVFGAGLTKLTYTGWFDQEAGTLSLNGGSLTLTGNTTLRGVISNGGTVFANGGGLLNGMTLDNGAAVVLDSRFNLNNDINLSGAGSGSLTIAAGANLRLTTNNSISGSSGYFVNNGTLTKIGGNSLAGTSTIYANFTNNGLIVIGTGTTLQFSAPSNGSTSTIGGTIQGSGTAAFSAGNYNVSSANSLLLLVARTDLAGTANVTLTAALNYAGIWNQNGGTLVVGSPGQSAGSLTLNGITALDNGLLKGTGTVLTTGLVHLGGIDLEGNLTFDFNSQPAGGGASLAASETIDQTGNIGLGQLADAITLANVGTTTSWLLEGNASIGGNNGTITNYGVFDKLSGAGTSSVQSDLINKGTLIANTGVLNLDGNGTLGSSVTGSAVLELTGNYLLSSGLSLTVAEVFVNGGGADVSLGGNLTYANNFALEGGTVTLGSVVSGALTPFDLSLTGRASLLSGVIVGPGTLNLSSAGSIGALLGNGLQLEQGVQLLVGTDIEQTGNINLTGGSSAPTITVAAGATYTLDASAQIDTSNNAIIGTLVVNGTLASNGTGINPGAGNVIDTNIVDNGAIVINYGEMAFIGPLTGSGSTTIGYGGELQLLSSSAVTNTIGFGKGGGFLEIGSNTSFAGTLSNFGAGDAIEFQGLTYQDVAASGSLSITGTGTATTVTIMESNGSTLTVHFSSNETIASTGTAGLFLANGPDGGLALFHN